MLPNSGNMYWAHPRSALPRRVGSGPMSTARKGAPLPTLQVIPSRPPFPAVGSGAEKPSSPETSAAKDRRGNPVAGLNAEFPGGARHHFEHGPNLPARRNDLFGLGLGVFRNPPNAAVALNEDHVQGHVGVLHPHGDFLVALEIEQHAVGIRH